jgi:lipocalin
MASLDHAFERNWVNVSAEYSERQEAGVKGVDAQASTRPAEQHSFSGVSKV